MRRRTILAGALALAAGCTSHGGGGRAAPGGSAAPAAAAAPGAPDLDPPVIQLTQPARGAFLPSGPVTVAGRVTDAGSGVAGVTVNGAAVALGPSGDFSTTLALADGLGAIAVLAADKAGNRADEILSVECGAFLPAGQLVPEGLAGRVNKDALKTAAKIAEIELAAMAPALGAQLAAANPIFSETWPSSGLCAASVAISIDSLAFGAPAIGVTPTPQGLDVTIDVPNVAIALHAQDTCGIPFSETGGFTADHMTLRAVLAPQVGPQGALDMSFPSVAVSFQNFSLQLGGALSWVAPIAEPMVESELATQIEDLVRSEGAAAIRGLAAQPATASLGGVPVTFGYALQAISTDADGLAFVVAVDLAAPQDPSYPTAPGSLEASGGLPAALSSAPSLVLSLSESALDRALESMWASGLLAVDEVPAQLVQTLGVTLPFGTTAQDLVLFFPTLRGVVPASALSAPLVFRIRSRLPPVVTLVPGAPDPLVLHFGEYEATAAIDLGGGHALDVFTVSMQADVEVGLAVQSGAVTAVMSSMPQPKVAVCLTAAPLASLGAAHVESFLDAMLPILVAGVVQQLPPIPLPALPGGASIASATIRADGTNGTYLTIEADVH